MHYSYVWKQCFMTQHGPHVLPPPTPAVEVIPVTADRIQADLLRNQRLGAEQLVLLVPYEDQPTNRDLLL